MARTLKLGASEITVEWNLIDRMIERVAPVWAAQRLQARVGHGLMASNGWGGGYNGASRSRRSLSAWNPQGGDADAQLLVDLPTLRDRSRDLERNSPVAGGAINTTVANVIGTGLSLQSRVDAAVLGLSDEEADAWQEQREREFELWASSADSDIARKQNFYQQTDMAFRCVLGAGDHCILLTRNPSSSLPIKLALQHIEGDRLCNPDRKGDRPGQVAGVTMDGNGAPTAYNFASGNPFRRSTSGGLLPLTWTTVPAFGSASGRRNVLHLFDRARPGQTRGIPMLAPVIEPLKQLERYTEAELTAAVVAGMFTVFIQSDAASPAAMPSALGADDGGVGGDLADREGPLTLGNGLIMQLGTKETANAVNPGRPNANFDPFVTSIIGQVGLILGIPREVLMKSYLASYSAARAALLDAWRFFLIRRDWVVTEICKPVYQAWLDEAVANGQVAAPGYFSDPLVRAAWSGSDWVGDGPGAIDPLKEVEAAERRVANTMSTLAKESILLDGVPWGRKLRQRARELKQLHEAGLPDPSATLAGKAAAAEGQRYPSDPAEPEAD